MGSWEDVLRVKRSPFFGFWGRLLDNEETKLKIMYDYLLNMYFSGVYVSLWILQVKQILDRLWFVLSHTLLSRTNVTTSGA